jgi:hypothetical protein
MADLFVWWDQDLTILPTGDLLTCDGTIEGEQRVLRRLLTPPQSYIWHPEYGAGLPSYVGQPEQADAIGSLILAQMLIEDVVSQDPLPKVTITPITDGLQTDIRYVDANTGQLVTSGFNVNV